MSLKDYVATLQALIAETPFVTATSFSYEERPPSAGLIKGNILFADNSQLDFREFLVLQPAVQVIKYAYNYRKGEHLIFRCDNASVVTMLTIRQQGTSQAFPFINTLAQIFWQPKNLPLK